jgi:osmotically-inducible protein OsmY
MDTIHETHRSPLGSSGTLRIARGGLALLAVLLLLLSAGPARAEEQPGDSSIDYWVKNALREDPRISSEALTVSTTDGIVKLSGPVRNLAARKYAISEAEKIKGVRGVLDEMNVECPPRFDSDIAQDILHRLLDSSSIQTRNIDVDVSDGQVTLQGSVSSWAEAEQAELLATETRGVKSVTNDLGVDYQTKRSDDEIRKDVQARLAREAYLTGLPIQVAVKDGVVTLSGTVGTAHQKTFAERNIRWIRDVKEVRNDLKVEWWKDQDTRAKTAVPTDDQLKQAARDELYEDLRLDPYGITVEAKAGQVTLRGTVPTFFQKRIAERDAADVVGTAWVVNLLDVSEAARSDASILADVRSSLDTDYALAPEAIVVKVHDGVVTLSGDVDSFWLKTHAYDVASRVKGVRRVVDEIRADGMEHFTDASIRSSVRDSLMANAETRWVANDIDVKADHGKVTLTGTVNFWSEYDAAENAAFRTHGVWAVVNDLHVRDYDYPWVDFGYPWPDGDTSGAAYPPHAYYYWW